MADQRLTDKTEITSAADGDFLHIIDVSDTSGNVEGTSKKIRVDNLPTPSVTLDEKEVATSIIGQKLQAWLPFGNGFGTVGSTNPALIGSGSNTSSTTGAVDSYSRWNRRQQTSAAVAGTPFGAYENQKRVAFSSDGFYFSCKVAYSIGANSRVFVGLSNSLADIGDVDISTLTNIIGLGKDVTDVNLQIMHNDASGIATKIDLGSDFDLNASKLTTVHVELFCSSLGMYYRVIKLPTSENTLKDTGFVLISTDLPLPDTGLAAKIYGNTGTDAVARLLQFNYMNLYV